MILNESDKDSQNEEQLNGLNALNDDLNQDSNDELKDELSSYPVLFAIENVPFPEVRFLMYIGREQSIRAVKYAMARDKNIFVCMQKKAGGSYPKMNEVFHIGVVCKIKQFVQRKGYFALVLEGAHRAKVVAFREENVVIQKNVNAMNSDVRVESTNITSDGKNDGNIEGNSDVNGGNSANSANVDKNVKNFSNVNQENSNAQFSRIIRDMRFDSEYNLNEVGVDLNLVDMDEKLESEVYRSDNDYESYKNEEKSESREGSESDFSNGSGEYENKQSSLKNGANENSSDPDSTDGAYSIGRGYSGDGLSGSGDSSVSNSSASDSGNSDSPNNSDNSSNSGKNGGGNNFSVTIVDVAFLKSYLNKSKVDEIVDLQDKITSEFVNGYCRSERNLSPDAISQLKSIFSLEKLVNNVINYMNMTVLDKQLLLEENDVIKRARSVYEALRKILIKSKEKRKIDDIVERNFAKIQRDMILREQKKIIDEELGEMNGEFADIQEQIKKVKMSKEATDKVNAEFNKLKQMNAMSAEASVSRSYIEYVIGMPWNKCADINNDILLAEKKLNESHYALQDIKDRVLEYISVRQRVNGPSRTVLCLVGAHGVGKTSLAKSIADSLDLPFIRIPLGGVRDESEIRGHKRTYIGAMAGKIIDNIKKCGVMNPVILLDEVDKMSSDFRGDPASALLELLDPEQNNEFQDNYLDVGFDLSKVVFICTANSYVSNGPLADRMEHIQVPGYTSEEKFYIAKNHLMKKLLKLHGLQKDELQISDMAIKNIIDQYTREAGVRDLSRMLSKIARKVVLKMMKEQSKSRSKLNEKENDMAGEKGSDKVCNKRNGAGAEAFVRPQDSDNYSDNGSKDEKQKDDTHGSGASNADLTNVDASNGGLNSKCVHIKPKDLSKYLGAPVFDLHDKEKKNMVGVVNGLAWTQHGGEVLTIEAFAIKGKGKIHITGNLGKVMEESVHAARSYVFANAEKYGIKDDMNEIDLHVHVPSGAVPKDGPSAGIAMITCLVSALTNRKINGLVAMTGEMSFRGNVLAIGGLKEKILGGIREGIKTIIVPYENRKDLDKIEENIKKKVDVKIVKEISEVIDIALMKNE